MEAQNSQVNILVIRSATRILNQTLLSLREEFPDCKITVLVPQSAQEAVAQDPLVDEVLTIPDQRRMGVSSYGKENIVHLREKKFDLAENHFFLAGNQLCHHSPALFHHYSGIDR